MGAHQDEQQNEDGIGSKGREQKSPEGNGPHLPITPDRERTEGNQRSRLTKKNAVKVPRKEVAEGKMV